MNNSQLLQTIDAYFKLLYGELDAPEFTTAEFTAARPGQHEIIYDIFEFGDKLALKTSVGWVWFTNVIFSDHNLTEPQTVSIGFSAADGDQIITVYKTHNDKIAIVQKMAD